jgi:hypothetical protein
MNDKRNHDETESPPRQGQVKGPLNALQEATLAVDLSRADLEQQITTAHRFPRKVDVAIKKITQLALYDEASAERCVYALPRAGKPIVGPSIGLMNIVASCWGNCRVAARMTYIDRREKLVFAEGAFLDLESNVTTAVSVSRRISGKGGQLYNDDMIGVTAMAAVSIARRNAIRHAVSEGVWFPIYERALYMVRGTEETLPERRDTAIKALAQYGVDPKRVLMFLNVAKVEEIGIEHMPTLRGLYTTLREGTVSAAELLDPRRMTGMAFDSVSNPLGDEDEDDETGAPKHAGASPGAGPGGAAQTTAAGPDSPADTGMRINENFGQTASANKRVVSAETGEVLQETRGGPGEAVEQPAGARVAERGRAAAGQLAPGPTAGAGPSGADQGKPAKIVQAAEPDAPSTADDFDTSDDYEEHALAWIAAATSASAIDDRYGQERPVRNRMNEIGRGLTEAQLAKIKRAKDARKAELRAKG